jgi:exodeoxyribonuclease VII small subunit
MSSNGTGDRIAQWEAALANGTFEEVFAALEEVVARLETGQLALQESVACFELGMRLAERCERHLDEAELRISRLERIADNLEEEGPEYEPLWS